MKKVNLTQGSSVVILRTDGRTHPAFVSSIEYDQNCVKVEWYENNETKGKEVDFVNVKKLNPNFKIKRPTLNNDSTDEETIVSQKRVITSNIPTARKSIKRVSTAKVQPSKTRLTNSVNNKHSSSSEFVSKLSYRGPKTVRSSLDCASVMSEDRTVKTVSKLQKARTERRKKQEEVKVEKEQRSKQVQQNPHWELTDMIQEYCKNVNFQPLTGDDVIEDHAITVVVRKRPLSKKDLTNKEVDVVTIPSQKQLIVHEPKFKVDLTKYLDNHIFKFDYTFNENCSNQIIYKYTAQPLVSIIFEGGFATCFAYGQTGSGKTYTMSGKFEENSTEKGIYALTAEDVFQLVNSPQYRAQNFSVSCSFFEIYSKKVLDLLNKKQELRILEDGNQQVQVVGLKERVVTSVNDVLKLIKTGNVARASGQTSVNLNSSRSHAIFQIYLRSPQKPNFVYGKFSLIDLAGNERGADTFSSSKQTRMEGAEINQSLLALKECIRALGRRGSHRPFRGSKLTQVLRDSFVGSKSKTCMIAMVSPGVGSCENTLNTLRYADRVKELGGGDIQCNLGDWKDSEEYDYFPQNIPLDKNQIIQKTCTELIDELYKSISDIKIVLGELKRDNTKMINDLKDIIGSTVDSLNDCRTSLNECTI